jgi:drug/metabolite transporter (DMT)-like permease
MQYAGEIYSLGAASVWAVAVILLRRSGETTTPFSLNLFRVGVSSLLLVVAVVVSGQPLWPERATADYFWLAVSGVVGVAVSDTFFQMCLNRVGAGINAVVDCLYSPFVVAFAFILLNEKLGALQLAGMALVIGGVAITSRAIPPEGATHRDLVVGILWGAAAMATLGISVVLAKPVLANGSLLWATTFRQVASFLVMMPVALVHPERRAIWSVYRPRADWRFLLPATMLGSFCALLLWLGGMKYTEAGSAAIINQSSTIFTLVLASIFLKEPFTARRWAAAGLAICGILLVTFG